MPERALRRALAISRQANVRDQMEYGGGRGIWNIARNARQARHQRRRSSSMVSLPRTFPKACAPRMRLGTRSPGWATTSTRCERDRANARKRIVRRAAKALAEVCGARIQGWRCPDYRISPNTFEVLAAEGFVWDSTMLNDDLPYLIQCEAKSLIELPFTTSTPEKSHVAFPYPMRGGPSGSPVSGTMNSTRCIAKATRSPAS